MNRTACKELSPKMRREGRTPIRSTLRSLQSLTGSKGPIWKEDRPLVDGSKEHPNMTAGLDIGDKYSYLCLLDSESGEVIQESRLRTTPKPSNRPFTSDQHPLQHPARSPPEADP